MTITFAIVLALVAIAAVYVAYQVGRRSTQWPSEDEMIVRLRMIRYHQKLEADAEADIEKELQAKPYGKC